jgi:hypothetical protein
MARVKGSAVRSSVAFLQEKLGVDGAAEVIGSLPEDDRKQVEGSILQSSWYDFSLLLRLMEAARPRFPASLSRSLAWELGRFSADYGLKTIYRIFFKVADPHFIIRKASQVFSNYYDSGKMEVVSLDPKSAHMRVSGFDQPCTEFCDRVQGWMERTLELTGAQKIVMSHPKCMVKGDSACDFVGRWS